MAATALNRTFNNILSTTNDWLSKQGKSEDIVFKANPTTAWLMKKDRYQRVEGGDKLMVNLMYAKNDTVSSVGEREVVDTSPSEGLTRAYYDRAIYSGQLSVTKLDLAKNAGAQKIIDMVKELRRILYLSMSERLNEDLWRCNGITTATTGNGGKNIISIPMVVPATTNALNTIDIGGIDSSVETAWNGYWIAATRNSWALLQTAMRVLRHQCSKGGAPGQPDIFISDLETFSGYEASLQAVARYTNNPSTASSDFASLEGPGGIPMFWDEHVPDAYGTGSLGGGIDFDGTKAVGTVYALNSNYLKLGYVPDYNFSYTPFDTPHDQPLAMVSSCLWIGQLMCLNRKKHGVADRITFNLAA